MVSAYEDMKLDDLIPLYVATLTSNFDPFSRAVLHTAICDRIKADRTKFRPFDDERFYDKHTDSEGRNTFIFNLTPERAEAYLRKKIAELNVERSAWERPGYFPVKCRTHGKLCCPTCGKEGLHNHLGRPRKGLFPNQNGLYCRVCRTRVLNGKVFTAL